VGCAALSLTTDRLATAGRHGGCAYDCCGCGIKDQPRPSVSATHNNSVVAFSPGPLFSLLLFFWVLHSLLCGQFFFSQSLFSSSLHDALNRRQPPRLLEQALQTFPKLSPQRASSLVPFAILTHAPSITSPGLSPRTRRLDLSWSSVGITNASRTLVGNVPPSASARKRSASDGSHRTDDSDVRIIVDFGGRLKLTIPVAVTRGPSPRHVHSR
jgi:hypothetical protein